MPSLELRTSNLELPPVSTTASDLIDRHEKALQELHAANLALLALARSQAVAAEAKAADDDGWTRMPTGRNRCPVSGWSRSTLIRRIQESDPGNAPLRVIRSKSVKGSAYYSAADVRRYLQQ
jgi:hypothetical protein